MTKAQSGALFLDRDGVININHGYVHSVDKFHFIDGIFELVRMAHAMLNERGDEIRSIELLGRLQCRVALCVH